MFIFAKMIKDLQHSSFYLAIFMKMDNLLFFRKVGAALYLPQFYGNEYHRHTAYLIYF